MIGLEQILGKSGLMRRVRDLALQVASSPSNVLITGERGTGKELVARVIHDVSGRRGGAFVSVGCSVVSPELLAQDLFGSSAGQQDGHNQTLLEQAHQGTLFLDEISELCPSLQARLIQKLEGQLDQRPPRYGSLWVDVRFVASTSANLLGEVEAKRFRQDLYYRLNVVEITLPPLRERLEDVSILAEAFLQRYSNEHSMPLKAVGHEAMALLEKYLWPGNVRELQGVLERGYALSNRMVILPEDLPIALQQAAQKCETIFPLPRREKTLAEIEGEYIRLILERTGGNKYQTAAILGIDRKTLYRKIAEMNEGDGHQ